VEVLSRSLSGLHVFHLYSKGGSSKRLNSEFIRDLLGDTDNYKIGFTKTLVCLISIPNISLQLARYELPLEAQSVMPLVCFQYATVAEHNHQLFTSEQLPVWVAAVAIGRLHGLLIPVSFANASITILFV
jgi:hypothetical protein